MAPPSLPDGYEWPQVTIDWWNALVDSPESSAWTSQQWLFLLDTALVHGDVWAGNLDRLPELRVRLLEFGFTPASAARLGMNEPPKVERSATPLDDLASRRSARGAKTSAVGEAAAQGSRSRRRS